jgi:hypothetical protein
MHESCRKYVSFGGFFGYDESIVQILNKLYFALT